MLSLLNKWVVLLPFFVQNLLDTNANTQGLGLRFVDHDDGETLAVATEKSVTLLQHVLSLEETFFWNPEARCEGDFVSSLEFVECDRTIIECQNKLACFMNKTRCTSHDEVKVGTVCPQRGNCMRVPLYGAHGGIVKCISTFPWAWPNRSYTLLGLDSPKNEPLMTTDFFFKGIEPHPMSAKIALLSSVSESVVESVVDMQIVANRMLHFTQERNWTGQFYTSEEVTLLCRATRFLFDPKVIDISATTVNGSIYNIDPDISPTFSGDEAWTKFVRGFRMPQGIRSISCSARRLDTQQWIRSTVNVTVIDAPAILTAESGTGEIFSVTEKVGCTINVENEVERKRLRVKILDLVESTKRDEYWIHSAIGFLRFQDMARGNYSCTPLNLINNSSIRFDYYFDPELKAPTIDKPGGASSVVLQGDSHRSLVCKYSGKPMPYVTWLYNGKQLWYTLPLTLLDGLEDSEQSILRLPVRNLANLTGFTDLDSKSSGDSRTVQYSCVVRNHLGEDRLNFIIEPGATLDDSSNLSGWTSTSDGSNDGLTVSLVLVGLLVGILLAVGFIYLREKHFTKKKVTPKIHRFPSEGNQDGGEKNYVEENREECKTHQNEVSNDDDLDQVSCSEASTSNSNSVVGRFQSGDPKYLKL